MWTKMGKVAPKLGSGPSSRVTAARAPLGFKTCRLKTNSGCCWAVLPPSGCLKAFLALKWASGAPHGC